MKENLFDTGKVILNFAASENELLESGSQPVLVLLHGGSGRWQLLAQLMKDLSLAARCYAPDLRGHGKSGRAAWGYTLLDYAGDIAAFLQRVSGPAFVYGHSLGGIVALMTAAYYPQYVRGVLVGDSPLDAAYWEKIMHGRHQEMTRHWRALSGGSHSITDIIAGLNHDLEATVPSAEIGRLPIPQENLIQELAERLYQHDPDVLGMLLDDFDTAAAGFTLDELAARIRCPVLLLQADPQAGGVMTDEEAAEFCKRLPGADRVKFSGLSHLMNYEDPAGVAVVMTQFLNHSA